MQGSVESYDRLSQEGGLLNCKLENDSILNGSTHVTPTHIHWQGQEPVPPGIHFAVGVFITVIGATATCSNILVVLICLRYKDLRTRSNLLIINLAVGDLLMCVIDFPLLAIASFHNFWPFGWIVCQMYAFLTAIAGMVTINTLAVVAFDRYWAVVRRPNPGQRLTKCATSVIIVLIWGYSIFWALWPIWGWGAYLLDGIGTTCTFDYLTRDLNNRSFVLSMALGNFALPFSVMIFSYIRIWMAVREVKSGLEKESSHVALGKKTFRDTFSSHVSWKRGSDASKDEAGGSNVCPIDTVTFHGECYKKHNENCTDDNSCSTNEEVNFNSVFKSQYYQSRLPFCLSKRRELARRTMNGGMKYVNSTCEEYESNGSIFQDNVVIGYTRGRTRDTESDSVHAYCAHFRTKPSKKNFRRSLDVIRNEQCGNWVDGKAHNVSKDEMRFQNDTSLLRAGTFVKRVSYHKMLKSRRENNVLAKIKRKNKTGFNLFLKQHRYRLHCEHKTVKIILFLLLAFTFSWCPYVVVSMIGLFGDSTVISYLTSFIPSLVAKTSIVFNPFLYSISHPKVRKRIIDSLCIRRESQQPQIYRLRLFRSSSSSNSRSSRSQEK